MSEREAKGLRSMSIFELVFIGYLCFAPAVYEMRVLVGTPGGDWRWRIAVSLLAAITPVVNLVAFRFERFRKHQDQITALAGCWLIAIHCYVLSCFPKGVPSATFAAQIVIVVSTYFTPGVRHSYARVMAGITTAAFFVTYVQLGEHPTIEGRYFVMVFLFVLANAVGLLVGKERDNMMRELFLSSLEIEEEKRQSAQLIANILPKKIAKELAAGGRDRISAAIPEASILFADIVGFTEMARTVPARTLIDHLSYLFSRFDALSEEFRVEKIKTIGDAYMAAGGVPEYRHDHLVDLVRMALKMQEEMAEFRAERGLKLRIGIHMGSVVAGVLGTKKFSYDLWGETVNFASRLEASAEPGTIQVSEVVAQLLKDDFHVRERGAIDLKGIGVTKVFIVTGSIARSVAA